MERPLSAIVGYAGCGKTTTLELVCRLWQSLGGRIEVAALSGIASLRASQATQPITGRPARTIYRLLQELKSTEEWRDNAAEAARLDSRTLLIIDEASMVGLSDWHRIVSAMAPGCRLLMSGDPMQLPPIDFGLVFHHVADEAEHTSHLTRVFRQDDATGIPLVAQAIRTGGKPTFNRFGDRPTGVSFIEVDDAHIPGKVLQIADDLGGFDQPLLIIAPTNGGPCGVRRLNALCHERFLARQNVPDSLPEVAPVDVKGYYGNRFSVGEPVIHVENDYKRGLFNGSLGRVTQIDPERRRLLARFDGHQRDFEFTSESIIRLALAYAVSCHKAQGTQIDRVIVPVYATAMLDRAWLYTALTRAVHQVVLVGSRLVAQQAFARPTMAARRTTGFAVPQGQDRSGLVGR
jgi:exodeoxyribonuclease V alpha subunit